MAAGSTDFKSMIFTLDVLPDTTPKRFQDRSRDLSLV